jgi:hypothetical protein
MVGEVRRLAEDQYGPYVESIEREIDLFELGEVIDRLVETTRPHQAAIDAEAAPQIHRHLSLTRREASDAGVWRFLTVVFRPEFVRHRWGHSRSQLRAHFWDFSSRPRPEHNAFSRLWWIAELSRDGDDYARTAKAVGSHCKTLFRCQLGHYPPAVRACIDEIGDLPQDRFDPVIKDLNRRLALIPVEGLSEGDLRDMVRQSLERQR